MKRTNPVLAAILAAAVATAASGANAAQQPQLEVEQVVVDTTMLIALGGSTSQRLAQSFTVFRSGELSHLTLPLSCQPKALITVAIEKLDGGLPSGSILAYEQVPGFVFTTISTPAAGFRIVEFFKPVHLDPGEYAFTLRTKNGDCGIFVGPPGDSYWGGRGFFESSSNPPGWIELFDAAGPRELAFQVFMRYDSYGP